MKTFALAALTSTAAAGMWPINGREGAVPPSFDCAMRKLAYAHGKQLLPRLGAFEPLFYALGLNEDCDAADLLAADANATAAAVVARQEAAAPPDGSVYADAAKGVDGASCGTEDSPCKSVQVAADNAGAGGTVVLRGGTFHVTQAVLLTSQHSGLTIQAYPNESPVISGGVELNIAEWKPYNITAESWHLDDNVNVVTGCTTCGITKGVADEKACQAICEADTSCTAFTWHDSAQGPYALDCYTRSDGKYDAKPQSGHFSGRKTAGMNIYSADVHGQVKSVPGLQLDGVRATRARYPNLPGGIEASCGYGCMVSSGDASWTPPNFNKYGPVKFYTDNHTATARNNTPSNWFQHYMIGIDGLCSVYDPPVGYWCSEHPSGGGAFAFRTPSGVTPKAGALPNAPYKDVSQAILNVWRPARWANWMFEIGEYDAAKNNFTFGYGGFQGARGNDKGGDFFIENVMEELDNPGEFFHDEKTGTLYLFHNGTGAPPASTTIVVPQTKTLLNVSGTQWDPVKDVTVTGVKFTAAAYTYMDPHGVPSAGDWALDRVGAVFTQGAEGVTLDSCTFERLDGNGVLVSGYNRNTTVKDSDFAFIGGNAVAAWGYTNETQYDRGRPGVENVGYPAAGVDGTDGEHPRYTTVSGCTAREVGLYEKQSSFFMQAKTAESVITGNVFFNGPRAGINANDGFGGGDEIAHNLVFSSCRESGDHGPFNSWDRQPFLTTVRDGTPSMYMAWRNIHHNFFIDNYSPQENVDNDDGSAYYHTHDNFLVYGGQGMKNDFGGHDNHHYNNIYAYSGKAMGVTNTLPGHEDYFYGNKGVFTGTDVGGVQCKAPATVMHDNQYFTSTGKITECGKQLADWQAESGSDQGSTVAVTPTDDVIIGWAKELFQMS
jgi:hypothetical protein